MQRLSAGWRACKANSNTVRTLSEFSAPLWLLFVLHFLDSFGMFAIATNLTTYLNRVYDWSDEDANLVYAAWGATLIVGGVPTGLLIDRFGLRRAMVVGAAIGALGKVLFAMSTNVWLSLFTLFLAMPLNVGLFGSAIDIAVSYYAKDEQSQTIIFGLLYATMNLGAIFAMYGIDLALDLSAEWNGYRLLFTVGATSGVLACFLALLFTEPEMPPDEDADARNLNWKGYLRIFIERKFLQLCVLTLVFTGVRSIFRYMETLLVTYLTRVYPETPYGAVIALNPILIIPLSPIMSWVTSHGLSVYWWMVAGSLGAALSPIIVWLWPSTTVWPVRVFLIAFTICEAIWSPQVKRWVIQESPQGKKGIYSGLIPIATFGGNILSGVASGQLLKQYCAAPETTLLSPSENEQFQGSCRTMWLWVMLTALTTPILLAALYKYLTANPAVPIADKQTFQPLSEFPLLDIYVDGKASSSSSSNLHGME